MMTLSPKRLAVVLVVIAGCATGRVERIAAVPREPAPNYVVIDKNREEVWAKAIPRLAQRFFVINNLDAASGLINVSYSGDPEKYVDGGTATSIIEPQGEASTRRSYTFPMAKARQRYEQYQGALFIMDRQMELEGRINIIVEQIEPSKTKVTANVRYMLTRKLTGMRADGLPVVPRTDTISFSSGRSAWFEREQDYPFWPTGALEAEILSAFKM